MRNMMPSIAVYLRKHNLSQAAFGAKIGVERSMVCRLISGAARPSLEVLSKIADVTRVPVAKLLAEILSHG